MNISTSKKGGEYTVSLSGRLDTITSSQLEQALQDVFSGNLDRLILDLAELEYISSAGLRVILSAQKRCKSSSADMVVKNAREAVTEVFEVTGFTSFLKME